MGLAAMSAVAENRVYSEPFTIEPGTQSAYQAINLDNEDPACAWQLSIALPEGLEITACTWPASADRKARYPYTVNEDDEVEYEHSMSNGFNANEGVYKIITFNTKGNNMTGNEGPIARVKYTASADFKGGDVQFTYFKTDYFVTGAANQSWELVNPCTFRVSVPVTAIENVDASKSIASVQYVNVAGQVSNTPFNGVNMVVTRYADGSTVTTKVIK